MKLFIKQLSLSVLLLTGFLLTPAQCMAAFEADFGLEIQEVDGIIYKVLFGDSTPVQLEVVGLSEGNELSDIILPDTVIVSIMDFSDSSVDGAKPTPGVVVKIGPNAFPYEARKRQIKLPSTLRSIGEGAFKNADLYNNELPEGLRYIGENAFYGADMDSLKIPESVEYLDFGAFSHARLRVVEFPSSLRSFGGCVLYYSNSVEDIYFHSEIPPFSDGSDFGFFDNYIGLQCDSGNGPDWWMCTLHVPAESVELYKATYPYSEYKNIVAIEEDEPGNDEDEPSSAVETSSADFCSYAVKDGVLTVGCNAGDDLCIYDANGLLLERKHFSSPADYTYSGSGVLILRVNGNSLKIVL